MVHKTLSMYTGEESSSPQKFLVLFVVGLFVILVGIIVLVAAAVLSGGSANFGTVIFIGPFPIVVGAGPQPEWMVLFAIILAVLSVVMFVILRRETERVKV